MSARAIRFLTGGGLPLLLLLALPTLGQQARTVRLDSHRTLGSARSFRNLTLFAVYDSAAKPTAAYVTLDEGLKSGSVRVKESATGGDVNTLYITNTGNKPLYVMAGEVVLGGQQDRCLGKDTIIPSGRKLVPIAVFCVEHGRWTGKRDFDESAPMVASGDVRQAAQDGAFKVGLSETAAAAAPPAARRVLQSPALSTGRAQQQVWDKVAAKNRSFGAAPATGTYRGVLKMEAGKAGRSVAPYVMALSGAADRDPHIVGMVAAINGQVSAADIFGDPALFRKLWPKLLRSYAADAAESYQSRDLKRVTAADVKSFLLQAGDAQSKLVNRSAVSATLRLESRNALTYRLMKPTDAGGSAAGGAAIHENVLRK